MRVNKLVSLMIMVLVISSMFAINHFQPVQLPGNAEFYHGFAIFDVTINGTPIAIGDEIGIFDGDVCVIAYTVTAPLGSGELIEIAAPKLQTGTGGWGGYTPGHPVIYKIWSNTLQSEALVANITPTYPDETVMDINFTDNGFCWVSLAATIGGQVNFGLITATNTLENTVLVDWSTNSEAGIVGFNVYRGLNDNIADAVMINTDIIPATNTSVLANYNYIDTTVLPSTTYYYWVKAVDVAGTITPNGTGIVTTPAPTLPVELSSFTSTITSSNTVSVNWTTQSESNMLGYIVYRSENNNYGTAVRITAQIAATNTSTVQTYNVTDTEVSPATTYYYWLQVVEGNGSIVVHGPVKAVTNNEVIVIPVDNTLLNNSYPNPLRANRSSNFAIEVKDGESAELVIYNVKGQVVKSYTNIPAGRHVKVWNGKDNSNKTCAAGVYFYRLSSPTYSNIKKMVILK